MRNTVVILNEELCSMSLAFEKAGFNVVATYEIDSKAYKISKENLGERVANKDILDMNICDVPDADVIVGKLDISSRAKSDYYKNNKKMAYMHVYQEIISLKQPRCFLFEVNKTSLNSADLSKMINKLKYFGYKINYNEYDVNELTGFPVDENKLYVLGMKRDVQGDFYLLEDYHSAPSVLDDFLENADIQDWYYDINYRQIEMSNDNLLMKSCFLCWKNHRYIMCDRVSWNTIKIPLVYDNHEVRQITHREVARLKGYPEKF